MIARLIRNYRKAYAGVPRNVWLISLVLLVSRSGTMVLPFLSIYFTERLDFSPVTIGWLLGIYGVGGILSGLASGRVIQAIGAIRTQILSLTFSIPGFLLVGMAGDFSTALASLFYLSLAVEIMRPAAATATVNFCENPDQHTKALAVNRLAVNVGMTIGPAIGGFLTLIDYRLLFYVNALTLFAALVLMVRIFGIQRIAKTEMQTPANESFEDGGRESGKPELDRAGINSRSPFKDVRFIIFCCINIFAAGIFFQIMSTWPLYLKEHYHLLEYHIGLLFAVNTIVVVVFELLLVSAIARLPMMRVYAWGQLLACSGFGILPFAAGAGFGVGFSWCAFTVLIWTMGEMLAMPLGAAYAARRSTESNRGRYMGLYVTSFSVAALVAPLVGMRLYERNPDLLWYCSLIVGGCVFFGLMLLADREARDQKLSEKTDAKLWVG